MLNNATIHSAIEKLQHGKYISTNKRARTNSIVFGALIGLNNNLPLEHNRFTIDRFCYDVIDPAVNRLTIELGNKTDSIKPTIRTVAHTFIKNRMSIIFEPLKLNNPIQSLSWMLASNNFSLFNDSILECYKRLDISPYSVDLYYAFIKFSEEPDNLYNLITKGLVAKLPKTMRVGNTEVPRNIPSTDELALLAAPLISIVLGYTLPLPSARVDDITSYIVSQHESNIFSHIDSINEKVIIDTDYVVAAVKHIYVLRYLAMFETATIAHNLVYMQLTNGTSNLPKELYEHFDDLLRDEVADDVRDILINGVNEETGGSNSSTYVGCRSVNDVVCYYDNVFNYIAKSNIEYDSIVLKSINDQVDQVERMYNVVSEGNVTERDVVALEDLYSSNYNRVQKYSNSISTESYKLKHENKSNYAVSMEAGMSLLGRALFGAIIGAIVGFLIQTIRIVFRVRKLQRETAKEIAAYNERIRKNTEEIKRKNRERNTNYTNKNLHTIFQIISKYNPGYKLPKLTDNRDSPEEKRLIETLCIPGKLEEIMTSRLDNNSVKQVSATFKDEQTMKKISVDMEKLFLGNRDIIPILNNIFSVSFISNIVKKNIYEQKLELVAEEINKELAKIKPSIVSVKETVMDNTVPVNGINISKLGSLDLILNFNNMVLAFTLFGDEKDINKLNTLSKEITKYIDDELKRGTLDEKASVYLNRFYKELSNNVIRDLGFVNKAYVKIMSDIEAVKDFRKSYAQITEIIKTHISGNK